MLRGRRTIPIQRQRRSPFRFVFTWKQIWAIRNALTIVRGCGCINNNNGTWLGLTYKWLWLFLGLTKHQTAIHEGKTCKVQQKKKKKKKKKKSSTKHWQSSRFKHPIQIWKAPYVTYWVPLLLFRPIENFKISLNENYKNIQTLITCW